MPEVGRSPRRQRTRLRAPTVVLGDAEIAAVHVFHMSAPQKPADQPLLEALQFAVHLASMRLVVGTLSSQVRTTALAAESRGRPYLRWEFVAKNLDALRACFCKNVRLYLGSHHSVRTHSSRLGFTP